MLPSSVCSKSKYDIHRQKHREDRQSDRAINYSLQGDSRSTVRVKTVALLRRTNAWVTNRTTKIWKSEREINFYFLSGVSANAVPHYQKLRTRVTHIWGNRKGQPNRSAMERPRPGGTAKLITVAPVPGKYAPTTAHVSTRALTA